MSSDAPTYACDRCQATSRHRAGFVRVGAWPRRAWRCRPCVDVAAGPAFRRELRIQLLTALGSGAVLLGLPSDALLAPALSGIAWVAINLMVMSFVWVLPLLVVHELAHWGVGRLVGLHILAVQIGIGRRLARFPLAGVPVSIHESPSMGLVWPAATGEKLARSRWALMGLAGPATHLLWIGAALLCVDALALPDPWSVAEGWKPLASFVLVNGILAGLSLVPMTLGGQATDGAILLSLPFMNERQRLALRSAQWVVPAQLAFADGDVEVAAGHVETGLALLPDDVLLRAFRANVQIKRGELDPAIDALRGLRALPELEAPLPACLANDLAWALALRNGPGDLALAEALCAEAETALGELPAVLSTRGSVLLAQARPEAAWPLLADALSKVHERAPRAEILYHLAQAEHALGHAESARLRLLDAAALAPGSRLRAPSEAVLARPAPQPPRPRVAGGDAAGTRREDEIADRRRRRRAGLWLLPIAASIWTCGPSLVGSALLAGVPYYDPSEGAPSAEVAAACRSSLARLDAASRLLSGTGVLDEWAWMLVQQRADLRECVGERGVARDILQLEIERLEAGLAAGTLEREDDWMEAALLLQARQQLAALEARADRPERVLAVLEAARPIAQRLDDGEGAWARAVHSTQIDAAIGEQLARGDPGAALLHYEAALARLEGTSADAYVRSLLLRPYAGLLEQQGRGPEARRIWIQLGRGADASP